MVAPPVIITQVTGPDEEPEEEPQLDEVVENVSQPAPEGSTMLTLSGGIVGVLMVLITI